MVIDLLKVFIVDDHPFVREGLKTFISTQSEIEICGEAGDGETALAEIKKEDFDRAYLKQMIDDHKKTLLEFNNATASKDSAVSTFARNMVPKLNMHLDEANAILGNMRKQINNGDISHN